MSASFLLLRDGKLTLTTPSVGQPLPVFVAGAPVGGGITYGAPVPIAMTGAAVAFIPANAARKSLMFWSPALNGAAAYDLSGGNPTLAGGIPLFAGAAPTILTGVDCPVIAIKAIGTNAQNLYYVEGV